MLESPKYLKIQSVGKIRSINKIYIYIYNKIYISNFLCKFIDKSKSQQEHIISDFYVLFIIFF